MEWKKIGLGIIGIIIILGITGTLISGGEKEEITPAKFEVSDLAISPTEVEPGQTVTISINVKNTGEIEGTFEARLKLDGEPLESKKTSLSPDETGRVKFEITKQKLGFYTLSIKDLKTTLEVKRPTELSVSTSISDRDGTPSMKVTLTGPKENYGLILMDPERKEVGTNLVEASEMGDVKESVWLSMEGFLTSPAAGTYNLIITKVENAKRIKVYESEFTFSGSNLIVKKWGPINFDKSFHSETKYQPKNLFITILNTGDLPAYLGDVKVTIDGKTIGGNNTFFEKGFDTFPIHTHQYILPGENKKVKVKFRRGIFVSYIPEFSQGRYSITYKLSKLVDGPDKIVDEHSTAVYVPTGETVNRKG